MIVITVSVLPNISCRVRHLSGDANSAREIEQIARRFAAEFWRRPGTIYRCGLVVAAPIEDGDDSKIEIMPLELDAPT